MDLRVLRYFVSAAQNKSISAASKALYITQPTLTRQFKELEEELGQTLFVRSKSGIELTEKGELFYERALEILALTERVKAEMKTEEELRGTIAIAAGETRAMQVVAQAMSRFAARYPQVSFNLYTVTRMDALHLVDSYCYDFALLIRAPDAQEYEMLPLNENSRWGVLVTRDDVLAKKESVTSADLRGRRLILPRTEMDEHTFEGWLDLPPAQMASICTINLINNGFYLVKEGLGTIVSMDGIAPHIPPGFVFVPLTPAMTMSTVLAWKKGRSLSKPAALFLEVLKDCLNADSSTDGGSPDPA
ncbi:MAG: LysR family transcriptional regulator [Proteobacteria bacterium]|uniref:LysR family transcriptional regulator n=1 Tax=Candidatus Avisuccinivibrio stercorigallinarum TaxID=2840704 RepID=A0A9D9DB42_9GAMM|nr:LysR family transcriptional regulator [Candidatus Avisuccinivibrio stercorigallinarum]